MDVKCGNGAFADTPEMALALARSLVEVANGAGLPTRALVTDMNQVLGHAGGNALEVLEAVEFLRGEHRRRGCCRSRGCCAPKRCRSAGWPPTKPRRWRASTRCWPTARRCSTSRAWSRRSAGRRTSASAPRTTCRPRRCSEPCRRPEPAGCNAKATRDIGLAVVELGGGRRRASDRIDHRVGFSDVRLAGPARRARPAAGARACRRRGRRRGRGGAAAGMHPHRRGAAAADTGADRAPARTSGPHRHDTTTHQFRLQLRSADRLFARRGRRRLGLRLRHHRLRLRDDEHRRRHRRTGRAGLQQHRARAAAGRRVDGRHRARALHRCRWRPSSKLLAGAAPATSARSARRRR